MIRSEFLFADICSLFQVQHNLMSLYCVSLILRCVFPCFSGSDLLDRQRQGSSLHGQQADRSRHPHLGWKPKWSPRHCGLPPTPAAARCVYSTSEGLGLCVCWCTITPHLWLCERSHVSVTKFPLRVRVDPGTWINDAEACGCGRVIKAVGAAVHWHVCQITASNPVFPNRTIQIWVELNGALNHECDGWLYFLSVCQFPYLSLPACYFLFIFPTV